MANPARKVQPRKVYGTMERKFDLLAATIRGDMDEIRRCVAGDPECIKQTDANLNNAMHLCVYGGASIRAPHIMKFYLEETEIDLLHRNKRGHNVLEAAFSLNDRRAIDLIEPYAYEQLDKRFPPDDEPELTVLPGGKAPGSEPGPT